MLAAVSSFYDWAIVAELVTGENPMRRRRDVALAMVAECHPTRWSHRLASDTPLFDACEHV
ncbi:hypothetical protein [Rhodococcus sp. USK13]|uniref:hypothetical protein n=1 Tax=Rhodococcus sp. USK13 TaxID=2806442 RepID=UPI001BCF17E0|nr:hypothetical protein [Rhodococcus sp. USK13]